MTINAKSSRERAEYVRSHLASEEKTAEQARLTTMLDAVAAEVRQKALSVIATASAAGEFSTVLRCSELGSEYVFDKVTEYLRSQDFKVVPHDVDAVLISW